MNSLKYFQWRSDTNWRPGRQKVVQARIAFFMPATQFHQI